MWVGTKNPSRRTPARSTEPDDFLCLLLSAPALSATTADGPRTEPQVQANSTILTCAAEKRQTTIPAITYQNSKRARNAIIRGLLSPPKPTPRRPVGGEVV